MSKTLVLDINELYRVVPETKSLEGKNFKDIRELLKNLIAKIEEAGQWQFIQYVSNKPSLFVIREETVTDARTVSRNLQKLEKAMKELDQLKASMPYLNTEKTPYASEAPTYDVTTPEKPMQVNASITTLKLPWEE